MGNHEERHHIKKRREKRRGRKIDVEGANQELVRNGEDNKMNIKNGST